MATKYWVGGTGTWDGFTATNWSDTSGGPGGAIAPCALDDVVFNSASNATGYTVTISTDAVCRDLTVAGPASGNVTVAGSAALGIFGSMTFAATGITRTYTGAITFRATTTGKTITTNGVTLGSNITFNGVGGEWTLGSAITLNNIELTNGTFNTANYAVTCSNISNINEVGASTLTLGSSAISMSGTMANFRSLYTTLNAGTSTITASSANFNIASGSPGFTFYNVTMTSAAKTQTSITGNNTFNNLTFTTPTNSALNTISLGENQTINGTLTISGSGAINRYMFFSDTVGTARTLTVNAVSALTDVDFRDITIAGASSPWSGTRLGNCGGNTNITFGAGTTKYWNLAAGGTWTAAAWATTSGGAASVLNFPLAQDTAVIENTGLNTGASITGFSGYNLNTLSCGTRSNAATLSGTQCRIYDDFTLSTSMTVTGLSVDFDGRTTQTLTMAGRTLGAVRISNVGSTVTLADAYNGSSIQLFSGTFDTNNQNITLSGNLTTGGTTTKTYTLGSSTISCTTFTLGATGITINAGTSNITCTSGGITNSTGGTFAFYNVTLSSITVNLNITGTNTFNNLTIAATTSAIRTVSFGGNQTVSGTLALGGGTSVTQRQLIASSTIGTQQTLTAATVTGLTDIDFRDIQGAGAGNWTTGTRLGDCGGNSGITFPATKTVYWNLAGSANWSSTGWATSSGGVPAVNNFPLAQDIAVFDNTGSAGTITLDSAWNIGTIDASARTSAWTLSGSSTPFIYGDVTYGSGLTASNTGQITFAKPGTQTFITAGKALAHTITINNPNCNFVHGDAYTSTATISITGGSYSTQNYAITASSIISAANAIAQTINLGSSTVTLSGAPGVLSLAGTNLIFSAGTSTLNLTSSANITLAGNGKTFNNVSTVGAAGNTLTISGSNTFNTLSNTNYSNISFTSGTTQTFNNFNYTGVLGSVVRLRTTTPGLTATVQKTSTWFAGANSTDGGNNTGWTFTAGGSIDYLYIKDIIAASAGGAGRFFLLF